MRTTMDNVPTVSRILQDKYGLQTRPGCKSECPFCEHKTFSVKSDDTIAKCFHPSCGRFVTLASEDGADAGLLSLLGDIFTDLHGELLGLRDASYTTAFSYLVDERKIHPQVVEDSMLGAVPTGYDVDAKFAPLINEAEAAVETAKVAREGKKGRPSKKALAAKDRLDLLIGTRDKLKNCVQRHAGWLAFFYTDRHHHVVAIRFRNPYTKQIVYFKPFKEVAGVFGHGLFHPYVSETAKRFNEFLIVVEGEVNQLQLQSLCLRYGEATKQEIGYVFSCAIGGVNNADIGTIRQIARHPVICYDHDVDNAGFVLVENVRQAISTTAFTTPQPDSDLDDFIRSFGEDHEAAWQAVARLVKERTTYLRSYAGVAAEIFTARQKHGPGDQRRDFEVNAAVAEIVLSDLNDRGQFYYEGHRCYVFLGAERSLIEIDPDDTDMISLLAQYGINKAERLFKYLLYALRTQALSQGTATQVHRLAHYEPDTFTLYVSNHKNQMHKIAAEQIDLVDNSTDGVLFVNDAKAQSFDLVERDWSTSPFDEAIAAKINFAEGALTASEMRLVFKLWFLSLFFSSLMQTKLILVMLGEKGSGKTHVLRKVGRLLLGNNFEVTTLPEDVKDFDAPITSSPFVVLDNADTYRKWLEDRLAIIATGGSIKRRAYYTTNTPVEFPACCSLAITCRTPYFRRDDVADRLLILRVVRFGEFVAERKLLRELESNRDRIMSEIIYNLQAAVKALGEETDTDYTGSFRVADFAEFAMKVARCRGVGAEVAVILEKLSTEQVRFPVEDDPTFDLVYEWASQPNNQDRAVTNEMLLAELIKLAESKGLEFQYKGKLRRFAQRMRTIRTSLREFFDVAEFPIGGHKKSYEFRPQKENESS